MSTAHLAPGDARPAGPLRAAARGRRWLAGALAAALAGGLTVLAPVAASAATWTTSDGSVTLTYAAEPATVMVLSGDGQEVVPGATFPIPLAVRVLDSAGNPVEGAPVDFAVTSGSATLSTDGAVPTSPRGVATSVLTAGSTPGRVTVLASVPGTAGATFTETVAVTASPPGNLAVSVTGPGTADARSTVRYTVSVSNHGPSDAQEVVVVLGATGIRASGPVRTIRIGQATLSGAYWTVAALPAGGSISHTVTGTVVARPGRVLVVAAGAIARSTPDPALGNNLAVLRTRVR